MDMPVTNHPSSLPASLDETRWAAVVTRDRAADSQFVYSVRTTGVYCRPSCPARLARRENVRFHQNCEEAERAGFRACKRCKPTQASQTAQHAGLIAAACRTLDTSEPAPDLDTLAGAAGLSRFHFHRLFKAYTGLTPKAYANARRSGRMREQLTQSASVTDAIYDSGFNSSSRFYSTAQRELGMAPKVFRNRGANLIIRFALGTTSLGHLLVAATTQGVCAILLGDNAAELEQDLRARFVRATFEPAAPAFARTVNAVVSLIETPSLGHDLPLDIRGTAFQQRVWRALREIPPGATVSYGELAARINSPTATRAVAQACGANPLAVAIPCHRVVRGTGELAGYRWGVERKRRLLNLEAAAKPQPSL
jgi:AraC family transcriptional regulator of adaptative response/methylated-DNA-[protein]-cysteine methyltransferase